MKSGETGFLRIRIDGLTKQALQLTDNIIFSIKSNTALLQREWPGAVFYEDGAFYVPLTQEDTTALTGNYMVEAQINFVDHSVTKSNIESGIISSSLSSSFIQGNVARDLGLREITLTIEPVQIISGGGASDYEELTSKPQINGVVLSGNKSFQELGLDEYIAEHKDELKGDPGPAGERGPEGPAGPQGIQGEAGPAGADGFSPTAKVERIEGGAQFTITDKNGTTSAVVYDGQGGSGSSIQYQNILDTDGTNGNGEAMLWDEIDRAWVYFTKRPPYDANKAYNYACIAKRTEDGKIIYTAQTIFNGTDFPVKSGGIKVTDIKRWSNYYLVTVRSGEPNVPSDGVDNTSIWGYLIILNASDLTVNTSASFNAKCSNVNVVGTRYPQGESQCFICISCQMSYFQVAKLTVSEGQVTINLRNKTYFKAFKGTSYTDIHEDIQEFQQGKMYFSKDMKTKLLVNAGFGWGIHIVDFSAVASTGKYTAIYNYNWQDHFDVVGQDYSPVGSSARAGSTFELTVNYPYVYATFAQPTEVIEAYNTTGIDCRVQGVLILDISDLNNIVGKLVKIPQEDLQSNTSGDPKPCTMEVYENEIYMGMGDRGIARFIADGMNLTYKGLIQVGKMRNVKIVRVDDSGNLMCRNSSGVPSYKYYDTSKYEMTLINLASIS